LRLCKQNAKHVAEFFKVMRHLNIHDSQKHQHNSFHLVTILKLNADHTEEVLSQLHSPPILTMFLTKTILIYYNSVRKLFLAPNCDH
jgi:hypothetical protein